MKLIRHSKAREDLPVEVSVDYKGYEIDVIMGPGATITVTPRNTRYAIPQGTFFRPGSTFGLFKHQFIFSHNRDRTHIERNGYSIDSRSVPNSPETFYSATFKCDSN